MFAPSLPTVGGSTGTWGAELNTWLGTVKTVLNIEDYGAVGNGTIDDAAALTAAISDLGSAGGSILIPGGAWTWKSVPSLPRNTPIRIFGLGATSKITLTDSGPRFLDFNKVADHDVFSNIEVTDLLIDCNNVDSANTVDHVIIGTFVSSSSMLRVNLEQITLRRIKAINIPNDGVGTKQRTAIRLACRHAAGGEATQNSIKNILVENVRIEGGCAGVSIVGTTSGASAVDVNIFLDNIVVRGCYHDAITVPTSAYSGPVNFHVGNYGYGRYARIQNCIGRNSSDAGIEMNAFLDGAVEDCWLEETYGSAFFHRNYRPTEAPDEQRQVFHNCHARRAVATTAGISGRGFRMSIDPTTLTAMGSIVISNCSWNKTTTDLFDNSGTTGEALTVDATVREVIVDRFSAISSGVNYNGAGSTTNRIVMFKVAAAAAGIPAVVKMKRSYIKYTVTRSGSGNVNAILIDLASTANEAEFELSDNEVDFNGTGMGGSTSQIIQFTSGTFRTVTIKRLNVLRHGDGSSQRGVRVASAGNTINKRILIAECDFSGMSNGTEISVGDATILPKTYTPNNIYRTFPKASAAMGTSNFVGGTFTTTVGNQYIGGDPADIHFANGTGSAITKIEASKDGSTYEAMWDQASGVMAQDVLCPVENGDFIKVTFSTTQPTTRVRFKR